MEAPTPHLSRRRWPRTAGVAIIPFLDSELEGHRNATKPYENLWDREEHDNRSILALESLDLVVGVDHHRRMKLRRRRRICSPPPRLVSGNDELQGLLGFEEEEETITTQEESHKKVAGVGRNGRSKLCRRRRCNRRRPPPSATETPPDHHQVEELWVTVPTPLAPSSFVARAAVKLRSKPLGSVWVWLWEMMNSAVWPAVDFSRDFDFRVRYFDRFCDILRCFRDILYFGPFRTHRCSPFCRISLRRQNLIARKMLCTLSSAGFFYGSWYFHLRVVPALWVVGKGISCQVIYNWIAFSCFW